jgi:hypothetical protein
VVSAIDTSVIPVQSVENPRPRFKLVEEQLELEHSLTPSTQIHAYDSE